MILKWGRNIYMKSNKKDKPGFSFEHFFFGYNSGSNARFGYLVKRILWCLIVLSAVKYWIEVLWGLVVLKDFACLPLLLPAVIATAIAALFCNFD